MIYFDLAIILFLRCITKNSDPRITKIGDPGVTIFCDPRITIIGDVQKFFLSYLCSRNYQLKTMNANKDKRDEILYHAYRCIYFNEKMIEQSDSWLSAEEGNKNMIQSIRKRAKIKNQQ